MIENINNGNLKNILRKVKLTKTRSNTVSIWLITFGRFEIKFSALLKFVDPQLVIPIHYSKFKIDPILFLSRVIQKIPIRLFFEMGSTI
jgi:hypothetical protein